ncbi:MAG: efflux RND transporter permease subunit [Lachnospiraceae bacterium]|nr:efflux RND transporter permease subunit [Lachnospiraceae bacterium]
MEKFSVKKPFTVLVGVIIAIVLGFVSMTNMQLDLLPDISLPYLMVLTTYPGASSEKIETEICEPMEAALGTINGIKNVSSVCNENYGMVQLEFVDDTDLDSAMVKVSSALNTLEPYLPDDAGTPSIIEISTDMVASVYLAVSMEGMEMEELSQFVRDEITPQYEKQNGVASVTTLGLVDKSVEVRLNEKKIDDLNGRILATVDEAFDDAQEQLDDAKKQLEDSQDSLDENRKKLEDSKKDLADGIKELLDSQQDLEDGKKELAENKQKWEDSKRDMEKAQQELDDKKKESNEKLADLSYQLDQASASLASLKTQLSQSEATLPALKKGIKQIDEGIAKIDEGIKQIDDGIAQIDDGIKKIDEGLNAIAQLEAQGITSDSIGPVISSIEEGIATLEATLSGMTPDMPGYDNLAGQLEELKKRLADMQQAKALLDQKSTLTEQKKQLEEQKSGLEEQKKQLEEQKKGLNDQKASLEAQKTQSEATVKGLKKAIKEMEAQVEDAYKELEKGKLEAAASIGSADAQLTIGKTQLDSAKSQFDSAEDQLETAQEQIDNGWDSIEDGQKQIKDGLEQIEDGQKQIDDGWTDYEDGVRKFEKQKAEAKKSANADKLLTLETLSGLIYAQNFEMPAGYVDDTADSQWLVKVGQNYKDVSELNDIVLTNINKVGDVKLGDVADIVVIDNADDSYVRLGKNKAVILSIFKSSTTGTNDLSKTIIAASKDLKAAHPGLEVTTLVDMGDYIDLIVNSVLTSMGIGALLAVVVLALFLKDVKPTLVVAISIPVSVLTAIMCMYFSGISLNMLSLSGLALGIGMLVDNSIVVMENIYRLRGHGIEAPRAAVQGTKQVAGSIIASTLTTVCVFLPMIFTSGMVRDLIAPMCLTIVFCLMASLLIAMTVVPASASTLLKNAKPKEHPLFDKVMVLYEKILRFCLKVKIVPIALALGLLIFSGIMIVRMGIVVIPEMTMNQMQADISYSDETTREEAYAKTDEVLERMLQIKGIGTIGVLNGNGSALLVSEAANSDDSYKHMSFMIMTEDENAGEEEIKRINKEIEQIGIDLNVDLTMSSMATEMDSLTGGSGLSLNVYGQDIDELTRITGEICDIVDSIDGYEDISNGFEDAGKAAHVTIDKNKAMGLGLSVVQIYQDINKKLTHSKSAVTITVDGIDMDIVVVDDTKPVTYENLLDYEFTVEKTDDDNDTIHEDHKLSEFATVEVKDELTSINRKNQSRYMTVTASVGEGYNTTLLTRKLKPLLDKYKLPQGYSMELGGEYDSVLTMLKQMGLVVVLGLLMVYLVMVGQFQSLLSPFIVLFTVPLAFTGGFLTMWICRENLSMISILGIVVLMGTVVNNGIVFVDYANQLRKGGLDRITALVVTGKTRMRPILMTALTTILAESNLIIGDDMGAQLGRGMALVIAGGLAYATLMTLFIIPVMYDILFKRQPLDVDTGSESLDDIPDDAAEYLASRDEDLDFISTD